MLYGDQEEIFLPGQDRGVLPSFAAGPDRCLGSLEPLVTTFYRSRMLAAVAPASFPRGRAGCDVWCCVRVDVGFTKGLHDGCVWAGLHGAEPASGRGLD